MTSTTRRLACALASALLCGVAGAAPTNVTLGKAVTASGTVGVLSPAGIAFPWCLPATCPAAPLSTLTDGVYLPESTHWQVDTIWWDERVTASADLKVDIELGGLFRISELSIQADNNDEYEIWFRDAGGSWHGLTYATACCAAGMATRAGGGFDFLATAFRLDARAGDQYYALSEFTAMGEAVPEPATGLLVAAAGLAAALRRPRRR